MHLKGGAVQFQYNRSRCDCLYAWLCMVICVMMNCWSKIVIKCSDSSDEAGQVVAKSHVMCFQYNNKSRLPLFDVVESVVLCFESCLL